MTGKLNITTLIPYELTIDILSISYVVSGELTMIPVETIHNFKANSNTTILLSDILGTLKTRATIVILRNITSPTITLHDLISITNLNGKTLLGYENGANEPYNCMYPQLKQEQPCTLYWDARDSLEVKLEERENRFIATEVLLNNKPLTNIYCKDIITAHNKLADLANTNKHVIGNCDDFMIPTIACSQVKPKDMKKFLINETNTLSDYIFKISNCAESSSFYTFSTCVENNSKKWLQCNSCLNNSTNNSASDSSNCFSQCNNVQKQFACVQGSCQPDANGVSAIECLQTCGGTTTDKYSDINGRCVPYKTGSMTLQECLEQNKLIATFSCDSKNFKCKYDPIGSQTNLFLCQQLCGEISTYSWIKFIIVIIIFVSSLISLIYLLIHH
jgi:hypothetical protein